MASRSRSNPLALAVLTCLYERPMHPYEIGQTLRFRAKQENIRLNYGSLYGVVESLDRRKLIRAIETTREGKRPQRTVYEITDRGAVEMHEWLSELVAVPVKEYLQFEAALSLLAGLPPDEAVPLLEQRCLALEMRIEQNRALHETAVKRGLPRLFVIEDEYMQALLDAELTFTRQLVIDIRSGDLSGLAEWQSWHDSGGPPSSGFTFPIAGIGPSDADVDTGTPDDDTDAHDDTPPGEPR
ncbi:MAG TPA: PadR family transcriptional regulator [Acidimicrobiales bacterium]|jgi:DNA-binding PadR family transcriptional regulator|nr:PadR family transcriptional regulator [Acidimicrobiales bacterium]